MIFINKTKKAEGNMFVYILLMLIVVISIIAFGPMLTRTLKAAVGIGSVDEANANQPNNPNVGNEPKCNVDSYCRVQRLPCQCFSSGAKSGQTKSDTCTSEKPYCYDGVYGCSAQPPDNPTDYDYCRNSIPNYEYTSIPDCIIGSVISVGKCMATNMPCKCKDKSGTYSVCIPNGNRYCRNNELGCVDKPC